MITDAAIRHLKSKILDFQIGGAGRGRLAAYAIVDSGLMIADWLSGKP